MNWIYSKIYNEQNALSYEKQKLIVEAIRAR